MSRIFVTSDTHFGHENIIRYASRPFADWRAMGEGIVERWNSRVDEDDVVYFLGDFAMGPGATEEYIVSILNRLHGFKYMLLGNHDLPSKYSDGLSNLIERHDFQFYATILHEQIRHLDVDGKTFVMCHYPMSDWHGKQTFDPKGSIHLHGHTHTTFSSVDCNEFIAQKCYDIGVDMYGGPVQITGDLRYLNDPRGWA